ncbi:unnamed protein product [Closterium sp. Yama58-4]|nr:unnamed protein product [Closterium sp. Yama58-4]
MLSSSGLSALAARNPNLVHFRHLPSAPYVYTGVVRVRRWFRSESSPSRRRLPACVDRSFVVDVKKERQWPAVQWVLLLLPDEQDRGVTSRATRTLLVHSSSLVYTLLNACTARPRATARNRICAGEIYRARDTVTERHVALKVEKEESVLKWEVWVLKRLQGCGAVCEFVHAGQAGGRVYVAMELLGPSLSDLRRSHPHGRFPVATLVPLALQMLRALRTMHDHGFLHRDVKPSNFAMGVGPRQQQCFVIDFGISKRFRSSHGVHPARQLAEFRGSTAYASVHSHLLMDLGRRDDLWSLFYVLVEFLDGELPWRHVQEKERVKEMKLYFFDHPEQMTKSVAFPEELSAFADHLQVLQYADKPDYAYLLNLLTAWNTRCGGASPPQVSNRHPSSPLSDEHHFCVLVDA